MSEESEQWLTLMIEVEDALETELKLRVCFLLVEIGVYLRRAAGELD